MSVPDLRGAYEDHYHDKDGRARMRCQVDQEDASVRVSLVVEGSSESSTCHAPFEVCSSGLGRPEYLVEEQPTRREHCSTGTIERWYDDRPLAAIRLSNGWRVYFDVEQRRFVGADRFHFVVPVPGIDVANEAHLAAIEATLRRMAAVFLSSSAQVPLQTRPGNVTTIALDPAPDGQVLYASHVPLHFQPWRPGEELVFAGRCAPEHHAALAALASSFVLPR
jgi:hypothetical protein